MNQAPQEIVQIPNYTNYHPGEELQKLRRRLMDLMKTGSVNQDMFNQVLMQLWNENERRRQDCLSQAEEHLRKYHAMVAQAHAFSAQSSIVFSIINGYVVMEERRITEEAERARERAEVEAEAKKHAQVQAEERAAVEAEAKKLTDQQAATTQETPPAVSEPAEEPKAGRRKKP